MNYPLAKLPDFNNSYGNNYINPRIFPKEPLNAQPQTKSGRKGTGGFTEQETKISNLKKENFSLKLRLFYLTSAADTFGSLRESDLDKDELLKKVSNLF